MDYSRLWSTPEPYVRYRVPHAFNNWRRRPRTPQDRGLSPAECSEEELMCPACISNSTRTDLEIVSAAALLTRLEVRSVRLKGAITVNEFVFLYGERGR